MTKCGMTKAQAEQMLSTFDLLLWVIQKDCGRTTYLRPLKLKVKACRKQLRDIPIPRGMT